FPMSLLGPMSSSIDTLEPRLLLAGISLTFSRGTLHITGTQAADNIVLRQKGTRLSVIGARGAQATALVKKVTINGLDGDDQIRIDSSAASLKIKFKISGGNGNDLISGSARADTISGDAGNDTILGLGGNDSIVGGAD